jgi:hypothetical protein
VKAPSTSRDIPATRDLGSALRGDALSPYSPGMDFRAGRPRTNLRRRRTDHKLPALAVIRWKHADGTESAGHPLPRAHAEALLRAFQEQFPGPTFWLEVPAALSGDPTDR